MPASAGSNCARRGAAAWTLYQEGTLSPDATHRWMGSIAMDLAGNVALAYSVSSSSVAPGLRFTGRQAGDALGVMTTTETAIVSGGASNASNRWGDYHAMSVDPSDDCTFWFTGQYSPATTWGTRILKMKFDSCGAGTTPAEFTDPALTAGVTVIKVIHITELRTRIDAVRAARALAPYPWTDSSLTAGQTAVRVIHLMELRTALNAAYVAAGITPPVYTDPVLTAGQSVIKAVHILELRAAVVALE